MNETATIVARVHEALRSLDLTDVHPAVVFEPTAPYRRGGTDA